MFFSLYAAYNFGASGGFSLQNLYFTDKTRTLELINNQDGVNGPYSKSGYYKAHAGYQLNAMNNLDVKIEAFFGQDFGKVQQSNKDLFEPGLFFGLVAKGELDFYETYSLYFGAGIYCSYATIHKIPEHAKLNSYFLPTITLVAGLSYYINDRISLCAEVNYVGFYWDNTLKLDNGTTVKTQQNGLRIGVGLNIRFEKLPFLPF